MWVWISEDGKYYAVSREGRGDHDADVYSVDGKQCWLSRRYEPKGFKDTDKRFLYPEFPHMTLGYSQIGYLQPIKKYAFRLYFGDFDTTKKIEPFTGNACLRNYRADFKRRVNIKKSLLRNHEN